MLVAPRVVRAVYPPGTFGQGTYFSRHGMSDITRLIEELLTMEAVSFCYRSETGIIILWRCGNFYRCLDHGGDPIGVVLGNALVTDQFTVPPAIRVELGMTFIQETNGIPTNVPRIRFARGDPPCWNGTTPEQCARLDRDTYAFPTSNCRLMLRLHGNPPAYEDHPNWQTVRLIGYSRHGLRADGAIICIEARAPPTDFSNSLFQRCREIF